MCRVNSAHWSAKPRAVSPLEETHTGVASLALKRLIALPALGGLARSMAFYNTLHKLHAEEHGGEMRSGLVQLTKVAPSEVGVRHVAALQDLQLRVEASISDPLKLLLGANHDVAEIRAGRGVRVELDFSLVAPRIVDTLLLAPHAQAPHLVLRDHDDSGIYVDHLAVNHPGHTG